MATGMTPAEVIWDDWINASFGPKPCPLEEIGGIVDGLGKMTDDDGGIVCSSGRLWVFRRLRTLWPESDLSEEYDFASLLSIPRSMKGHVFINLPRSLYDRLQEETRAAKSTSWLKGLWGACGSLYLPKTGYYLCFRVRSGRIEERAVQAMRARGISARRRRVQGTFEIMLRNQQEIADMLTGFNMIKTVLLLEERAIFRSLRNRANKLVNCDASNIRKSLEASSNQIEISKSALEHPEYESFPLVWKELISTRLANPSVTLEELGRMQSPPISKSTVKYRWKKISDHVSCVKAQPAWNHLPRATFSLGDSGREPIAFQ